MTDETRNSVTVTIHGTEYRVSADADPAYIEEVAAYVDATMAAIRERLPFSSSTRLAILTALHIADQMMRERSQRESVLSRVEEKAETLRILLESAGGESHNQAANTESAPPPAASKASPQTPRPGSSSRR